MKPRWLFLAFMAGWLCGTIAGRVDGPDVDVSAKHRYRCLLCGRDRFTDKVPHNCHGGYRKRGLTWEQLA